VLAAVAERTATAMRPYDLLGRIGGEEFLIIAPAADLDGAASIAERTRARISASPIGDGADAIRVTASFGVTLVVPDEPEALDRALARADAAMYESKDTGRDRVSVRPHDGSERS
jgi:diguanylate cyclase (GGDEF)-like protein